MDRFGRKTAFLTLYAGFLVGTFLCGLAQTYATLLAARVVTGAFGGILGGMALAIVGDVFPEHKRGRATGVLMSAFALGVGRGRTGGDRPGESVRLARALPGPGRAGPAGIRGGLADPAGAARPLASRARTPIPSPGSRETFSEPNHLRAFALVATMMLGGFAVIPVYLRLPREQPGCPRGPTCRSFMSRADC